MSPLGLNARFVNVQRARHALAVFVCCFVPSSTGAGEAAPALLARFKSEAREAWKTLELADQSPATIKIGTKLERHRSGRLQTSSEKIIVVKRKSGHFLVQAEEEGAETIYGQNPKYRFLIGKKAGSEGWLLMELVVPGPNGFPKLDPQVGEYVSPNSWSYLEMSLSALVAGSRFRALKAESVEPGLVRVHYETAFQVAKAQIGVKGWMDLDPTNAWALNRCQYQTGDGDSATKISRSFAPSKFYGVHPCEVCEGASSYLKTKQEVKARTRYEIMNSDLPSDPQFYLSSYGLPEPRGVEPPSRGSFLAILFVAVWALTVGMLLRQIGQEWRLRRAAASQRTSKTQIPVHTLHKES